jgi:hypothetical protein
MGNRDVTIGGVQYRISGADDRWIRETCSGYGVFLETEGNDEEIIPVDIVVRETALPSIRSADLVFEGGPSWSIFNGDGTVVIVFKPRQCPEALWSAVLSKDGCRWDVFLQPEARKFTFPPLSHPLDQLILMFTLCGREGILVHGTGAVIGGRGYLFLGKSGSGKSTLAGLLSNSVEAAVLSDERMVVRNTDNGLRIFGTPWFSDARKARNSSAPLDGIFFLHHGKENRVEPCSTSKALEQVMPVSSILWFDRKRLISQMDFCGRIVSLTPSFDLYFRPDLSVTDAILRAICC